MADKEIIIDGCEFQSDCIEYKDISYLKIMLICAIHELSIACHDKVNKCKYYKLYKQLKAKEQECEKLKAKLTDIVSSYMDDFTGYNEELDGFDSVQELKEFVLKELMYSLTQPECNIVKRQVRTLFEERKNDR